MRKTDFLGAIIFVAVAAHYYRTPHADPIAQPQQITPVPQKHTVAVQTPKPQLLPDGVYVLTRSMSVTTESGIIGIHPGTAVRSMRDDGATLHVVTNQMELDVRKEFLTNDLATANRVWAQDFASQAKLAEQGRKDSAIAAQQEAEKEKQAVHQRLAVEAAHAPRPAQAFVPYQGSNGNPSGVVLVDGKDGPIDVQKQVAQEAQEKSEQEKARRLAEAQRNVNNKEIDRLRNEDWNNRYNPQEQQRIRQEIDARNQLNKQLGR